MKLKGLPCFCFLASEMNMLELTTLCVSLLKRTVLSEGLTHFQTGFYVQFIIQGLKEVSLFKVMMLPKG